MNTYNRFWQFASYQTYNVPDEEIKKYCEEEAVKIAKATTLALLRSKLRGRIAPKEENLQVRVSGGVEISEKKVTVHYSAGFFSVEMDVYPDIITKSAEIKIIALEVLKVNGNILMEMHPGLLVGQEYTVEKSRA